MAEPDGVLTVFVLHPAPGLLQRQARQRTAHRALIADILSLLAGRSSARPPAGPRPPIEPLSTGPRGSRSRPSITTMHTPGGEARVPLRADHAVLTRQPLREQVAGSLLPALADLRIWPVGGYEP